MVRTIVACVAAGLMVAAAGCAPPEKTVSPDKVPTVTLTTRTAENDQVTLTFTFTNMERADWHGKSLHAEIVKVGQKPSGTGPDLTGMPADVTFMIGVAKAPKSETVTFVPMWSTPPTGDAPAQIASPALPSPDGPSNSVTASGHGDLRISQVLSTCVGPGGTVPFNPEKGLDLLTIGYLPDAYAIHVWIDRSSAK